MPNAPSLSLATTPTLGRVQAHERTASGEVVSDLPAIYAAARRYANDFADGRATEGTRLAYKRDLRQFIDWCEVRQIDPRVLDRATLDDYLSTPRETGQPYSTATQLRRMSSLTGYYAYVTDERWVDVNPLPEIDRTKLNHKADLEAKLLGPAELRALIRAADARGLREAAFMRLLIYNGLRVTELVSLEMDSLRLDAEPPSAVVYNRRRRDPRSIVLNARTAEALDRYIHEKRPPYEPVPGEPAHGDEAEPVFLSTHGRGLHRQHVAALIWTLCRHARIPRVSPDGIRASFAGLARKRGVPPGAIHEALGHAGARDDAPRGRVRHPALVLANVIEA